MVKPDKNSTKDKKQQVEEMFNKIAPRYDFLNHTLSMGIDILWRKKAVRILKKQTPKLVLDVATGTGDFAIENLKSGANKVIGVDISDGMLEMGRKKIKAKKLEHKIELINANSENLPFSNQYFDGITVGFGVRNFENLELGLSEMLRVLKPDGLCIILEFSKPKRFPIKNIYNIYFNKILPGIGKKISKDNTAYSYLPESVEYFPDGSNFTNILERVGFRNTKIIPLTFGIASIYLAYK